jgi:hypothetical protein
VRWKFGGERACYGCFDEEMLQKMAFNRLRGYFYTLKRAVSCKAYLHVFSYVLRKNFEW